MSIGLGNGKNGTSQPEPVSESAGEAGVITSVPVSSATPIRPVTTNLVQGCPHLGVIDDADTRFLFASPVGTCYRATPAGQITLEHQQAYCLGDQHGACPVFRAAAGRPLPGNMRVMTNPNHARRRYGFVGFFVLLGLVTAVFFLVAPSRPSGQSTVVAPSTTPLITAASVALVPTSTATSTATQTAVPTASPTQPPTPLPTVTIRPTDIPTTLPPTFTVVAAGATSLPTPTAAPLPVASVIVRLLNVREGPGVEFLVVGAVAEGDTLDVIGQNAGGGWWQVCCVAGQPGWVIGEAIALTGDTTNVPVVRVTPRP